MIHQKDKHVLETAETSYLQLCMGYTNSHERIYFMEHGMMEWLMWPPLSAAAKKRIAKMQSTPRSELIILLTNIVEVSVVDGY